MSFQIRDERKDVRADVTADGTVKVNEDIVAFLNDDGSAGDKNQVFLGDVDGTNVRNAAEKSIGNVDEKNMSCYDIDKRILVKITESGEILNRTGKIVGSVSPFRPKDWKLIIAYLYFVDPALVLTGHFSLVTGVTGKGFSFTKPLMLIIDKNTSLRAKITADGSVTNSDGTLLGFLNEDGSAGDNKEHFLGEIASDCRVINKGNVAIGSLDETNFTLTETESGQVIAKIGNNGELYDEKQNHCGSVDFYSPKKFRMVAAYLFFFDTGLIKARGHSLVVRNVELEEQLRKEEEERKRKEEERKKKVEEESEALRKKMEEERQKVELQLKAMAEAQAEAQRLKQLLVEQEEKRRIAEEEKRQIEEKNRRIEEEKAQLLEETQRAVREAQRKKEEAEAEKKRLGELEAQRREDEIRIFLEEARRRATDEAESIRLAAEEAARKHAEAIRIAAEEEARRIEEEARLATETEARKFAEVRRLAVEAEEAKRLQGEQEAARLKAEEEAVVRRQAIEEELIQKELELRKKAEEEFRKKS